MCCGDLSSDEWITLKQDDTSPVDLNCEDDAEHQVLNDDVACASFGYEKEEVHELRLAEYADVLRWEAKCLGRNYLGYDEIRHHNSVKS